MQVAIVSDTHDNNRAVTWIIDYLNEHHVKMVFHAGDIVAPGVLRRFKEHFTGELHFVFGNNDGEKNGLQTIADSSPNVTCHGEQLDEVIEGKNVFMHHYPHVAQKAFESGEYDLVIAGHSHNSDFIKSSGKIMINPGSTSMIDKWFPNDVDQYNSFVVLDWETSNYEKVLLPHLN